jgi:SAM-dependent methyltransferase
MPSKYALLTKIRSRVKNSLKSPSDRYSHHFNTPIKFAEGDWQTNERIVELPYVFGKLGDARSRLNILEFGCTRSHLAVSLASMGHTVTGVDLRPYPFHHPNFEFFQGNLLTFEPSVLFDCIVSISVLEHIGLGAYGEPPDSAALEAVIEKLGVLLRLDGKLIVTVPFGRSYADEFLRSFAFAELKTLFRAFELTDEAYYVRDAFKYWQSSDRKTAASISNAKSVRGKTGVNCVVCLTWKKLDQRYDTLSDSLR